jgi:hypothetical protein
MESFSKKSLWIAVAFLLVANLALVGFVFFGRGGGPKKGNDKLEQYLTTELNMTPDQVTYFQESVQRLRNQNRNLGNEKRKLKKEVLLQLGDQKQAENVMQALADLEYQSERAVYDHFQEVRTNLSAEQALKFDEIIVEALARFGPKGGGPGEGPGDGRRPPKGDRPPPR